MLIRISDMENRGGSAGLIGFPMCSDGGVECEATATRNREIVIVRFDRYAEVYYIRIALPTFSSDITLDSIGEA